MSNNAAGIIAPVTGSGEDKITIRYIDQGQDQMTNRSTHSNTPVSQGFRRTRCSVSPLLGEKIYLYLVQGI